MANEPETTRPRWEVIVQVGNAIEIVIVRGRGEKDAARNAERLYGDYARATSVVRVEETN